MAAAEVVRATKINRSIPPSVSGEPGPGRAAELQLLAFLARRMEITA
jgi:hypothetical protein